MFVSEKSSNLSKNVDDHIKRFVKHSNLNLNDLKEISMISLLIKLILLILFSLTLKTYCSMIQHLCNVTKLVYFKN